MNESSKFFFVLANGYYKVAFIEVSQLSIWPPSNHQSESFPLVLS